MKNKKIKIISGKLKNHVIHTIPNKNLLRPTTNYVKKTLFNWLHAFTKNSFCLDCFSGSGSLGIEAISKYAKKVFFLEKNLLLVKTLKKNLIRLKIKNFKLIKTNTINWLQRKKSFPFDIIFLDPPYKNINLLNKTISLINNNKWIKKKSLIYLERENLKKKIKIPKKWHLWKSQKTKKIKFQIFFKK